MEDRSSYAILGSLGDEVFGLIGAGADAHELLPVLHPHVVGIPDEARGHESAVPQPTKHVRIKRF